MARLRNLCLIAAFLISGPVPLLAQDVFIQNEPQLILPIGLRSWEGTHQELRRIDRVPVPSSYRARCEREELSYTTVHTAVTQLGCYYDLLNWHFNFGTARSAESALDYIAERVEREHDLSPNTAERYIELLPEGLSEAKAYLAAENLTYETFLEEDRIIEAVRFPALAELSILKEKLVKLGDIASFYTRAAGWYRSPSLLREATRWHGYLPKAQILEAGQSSPGYVRLLSRIAHFQQDEFQDLSLAVARATVLRTEESILAANATSARVLKSTFQDRDFRQQSEGWDAKQYRYLRFRIQLLADVKGLDVTRHEEAYLGDYDFDDIEALIRPDEREMDSIHYLAFSERGWFGEAIIAQGERDVQLAQTRCAEDSYDFGEGLAILFNGGRVVSNAHSPVAYGRIAQLYLELYAALKDCKDEEGTSYVDRDVQYRNQARFYQQFLDNYEEIALGR